MSTPTKYVSLTGTESYNAYNAGLCVVCASKMQGGDCLCRFCDSCTQYWISDTYRDSDDGRPAKEQCPDCDRCLFWSCDNPAPTFAPPDWFEPAPQVAERVLEVAA